MNILPKKIKFNDEIAYRSPYDGYYATLSGEAISVKVKGGQGSIDINNPHVLSKKVDKDGYFEICLSEIDNDGNQKRLYRRIHRFLWETIFGGIPNDMTIDHIDMNKQNNHIENLRLLTCEENTSIANKGHKSQKRFMYKLSKVGEPDMILDRNELIERFDLSYKSFYSVNGFEKIYEKSYTIEKVNVENNERVS